MRADFERGLALGLAMGGLSVGEVKEIPAPEPEPVVQYIYIDRTVYSVSQKHIKPYEPLLILNNNNIIYSNEV